jgi:Fic family protein
MVMARTNGSKTERDAEQPLEEVAAVAELEETAAIADDAEPVADTQDIDDSLTALKTLLSTVEKLQKVRQEVGDIKPLLLRMLDGEVITGEELEQLKTGVGGLFKLVRAYTDHQTALAKAQPARELLDQVLKVR